MTRVAAYHSSNPDDPDVHHVHSDCPPGSQIPDRNKVEGTGGYRGCEKCQQMG